MLRACRRRLLPVCVACPDVDLCQRQSVRDVRLNVQLSAACLVDNAGKLRATTDTAERTAAPHATCTAHAHTRNTRSQQARDEEGGSGTHIPALVPLCVCRLTGDELERSGADLLSAGSDTDDDLTQAQDTV